MAMRASPFSGGAGLGGRFANVGGRASRARLGGASRVGRATAQHAALSSFNLGTHVRSPPRKKVGSFADHRRDDDVAALQLAVGAPSRKHRLGVFLGAVAAAPA